MTPAQTKLLLAAGAALTAGLIWFAPVEDGAGVSEPSKAGAAPKLRVANASSSPLEAAAINLDQTLHPAQDRGSLKKKETGALFAKSTWELPPPPPRPAPPPPPPPPVVPTAPPLPFVFMGKFEQGDTQLVILNKGNRVINASQGDVLDKTYRIDRIEASKVTFTYLPLGTSQSLSTGGSQ